MQKVNRTKSRQGLRIFTSLLSFQVFALTACSAGNASIASRSKSGSFAGFPVLTDVVRAEGISDSTSVAARELTATHILYDHIYRAYLAAQPGWNFFAYTYFDLVLHELRVDTDPEPERMCDVLAASANHFSQWLLGRIGSSNDEKSLEFLTLLTCARTNCSEQRADVAILSPQAKQASSPLNNARSDVLDWARNFVGGKVSPEARMGAKSIERALGQVGADFEVDDIDSVFSDFEKHLGIEERSDFSRAIREKVMAQALSARIHSCVADLIPLLEASPGDCEIVTPSTAPEPGD